MDCRSNISALIILLSAFHVASVDLHSFSCRPGYHLLVSATRLRFSQYQGLDRISLIAYRIYRITSRTIGHFPTSTSNTNLRQINHESTNKLLKFVLPLPPHHHPNANFSQTPRGKKCAPTTPTPSRADTHKQSSRTSARRRRSVRRGVRRKVRRRRYKLV